MAANGIGGAGVRSNRGHRGGAAVDCGGGVERGDRGGDGGDGRARAGGDRSRLGCRCCVTRCRCRAGTRWRWWGAGCGSLHGGGRLADAAGACSCWVSSCSAARCMRWSLGEVPVGMAAPFGGGLLMLGWLLLAAVGVFGRWEHHGPTRIQRVPRTCVSWGASGVNSPAIARTCSAQAEAPASRAAIILSGSRRISDGGCVSHVFGCGPLIDVIVHVEFDRVLVGIVVIDGDGGAMIGRPRRRMPRALRRP